MDWFACSGKDMMSINHMHRSGRRVLNLKSTSLAAAR